MPQIQTIYDGNFIVWQRKLAEITVDLKSDLINLQQFGVVIAESDFFNFTLAKGIHLFIDVAATASPNVWTNVYSGALMAGAGWTQDPANQAADQRGTWQENTYLYDRGVSAIGRYVRFRLAADDSFTPLQTVAIKKVLIRNHQGSSLTAGAVSQTNALGWQTGEVLKDVMEDLLENRVLLTTSTEEIEDARISPKGTWNPVTELYTAPAPRMFASLVERLNDLEKDAERRLTARKMVIPVEENVMVLAGVSEIATSLNADAPYRKVRQYVGVDDTVDVLVQLQEGVGAFEEPLRDNGVLIYGKVTYGVGTTGYVTGQNAKVTLYRTSDNSVYSTVAARTLKLVLPVETDLYHMDKYDLTRTTFATGVIQDIGVLNDIDAIQSEIRAALLADTVNHQLVVYDTAGLYYADLIFDSAATAGTGWQVSKNGLPAVPGMDFTFVTSQKIRLDTHDNNAPTAWSIQYFTKDKANLDSKLNEIIAAIARLTVSIMAMSSNIDEINDALAVEIRTELLQFDRSSSDGYEYFKPLTYAADNNDNVSAILYKNGVSIGAKDSVWAFRGTGVVALFRDLSAYDRDAEYSIRYFSHQYDHLNEKISYMVKTTDRDLIVKNWDHYESSSGFSGIRWIKVDMIKRFQSEANEWLREDVDWSLDESRQLFTVLDRQFAVAFCEEFGLQLEWLEKFRRQADGASNEPRPALFGSEPDNGLYLDGIQIHNEQNIIGGVCYSSVIQEMADVGLLDFATGMKMLLSLSDRFLRQKQGEESMKAILSKEALLNGAEYHKDEKTDSVRFSSDLVEGFDRDSEKYQTGFDAKRIKKYDSELSKTTVGDLAAAFGEAYHEASSRRRLSEEEVAFKKTFGVSRKELSTVSETYPGFYIPLALQAVEAVTSDKIDVDRLSHWRWSDEEPLQHKMFEVALNKEERMLAEGTRIGHFKSGSQPVWIQTAVESSMSGTFLVLKIFTKSEDVELATKFKEGVSAWIKANNYLRGQKIDGAGKFLDVAKYDWDDVVLDADIKDQIFDDIVGFLNHEELYKKNGLPFKRGIILYGKPGCGKTLLGKVIANEIKSTFVWLTSAQVASAKMIRSVFELARDLAPCVLFFEDIDMYTVDRSYGVFNPLVGEMLAQMDGMEENNGIIVVATTNRLDAIENALATRPSRFDRRFSLDEMAPETVEKMVSIKLGSAKLLDVTIPEIARMLQGLNGSFIQEVVISAKRKAISRGLTNSEGIVLLNRVILSEAAGEVARSFRIMLDAMDNGNYKSYVDKGADSDSSDDKCCSTFDKTAPVVSSDAVETVTLAAMKDGAAEGHKVKPQNVNLTQLEKEEVDGEIKAALLAIASANEKNKSESIKLYVDDAGYESLASTLFGEPIDKVVWKEQPRSSLRTMFRMLVLCRNVRRAQGKAAQDPFNKLSFMDDMLHAMDMRSDRYYWVHALVRIEEEFGRKINLPFNPYKDQTSKGAAIKLFNEITGKVKTRKEQAKEINEKNGVFEPAKQKFKNPELEFNEPVNPDNMVLPPQHMK